MATHITPEIEAQVRDLRGWFPYRLIYVAVHPTTAETIVSAVTSKRIPNKLAREGWNVAIVS